MTAVSEKRTLIPITIGLAVFVYVIAGIINLRDLFLLNNYSPAVIIMRDYEIYRGAIDAVNTGADPYLNRTIGVAFLYPPPFLLIAQVLALLPVNAQEVVFTFINLLILAWIAWALGQGFDRRKKTSIILLFLFLFAGPLLELLIIGQINLFSLGGILMVFLFDDKKPWLAGLGLCLGAITKVTPLIFMGYLFINRRFRALIWSVVWMIVVCLFTGLVYGFDLYSSFLDQFFYLLTYIGADLNNQGLLAKLQTLGIISSEMVPTLKTLLTGYYTIVVLVTALAAWVTRERVSTFVMLLLVMVLAPNLIWYHHYVFLLPAVILLVGERRKSIWVYALAATFLLILQVDRFRLTSGLLIQACSHLTLLGLWVSLLVKAIQVIKSTRAPTSLLPKISHP